MTRYNIIKARGSARHINLLLNWQLLNRDFKSQKQATRSLNFAFA